MARHFRSRNATPPTVEPQFHVGTSAPEGEMTKPPVAPEDLRLRVCHLNGQQYIIPDREWKGAELRDRLIALAGADALRGDLIILAQVGFLRTYVRVTPDARIGSAFAEPGTIQAATPFTLYTLRDEA